MSETGVPVVLALGSNLGDCDEILRSAVSELSHLEGLRVVGRSAVVETDPVGGPPGQQPFLNAVLLCECWLAPMDLLEQCQRIEAEHDRVRQDRWGPRTLDIDIITFGEIVDDDERLTLPHKRAHERAFVLVPWAQVDPEAHLPGPNGGHVSVLAMRAEDRLGVRKHVRKKRPRP